MKILKITESQYKRLVIQKNLNEQIVYPSKEVEEMESNDITPDINLYLGWLSDTLSPNPLYVKKIENGVVYIDWSKYGEEQKDLIKKYNKEWVDYTVDSKDKITVDGLYDVGNDWDFEDTPTYVYNPEEWTPQGDEEVVFKPEEEVVVEPIKTTPNIDGKYDISSYKTSSLLKYYRIPKKDIKGGLINPDLINDIIKALESINMTATITTTKSDHDIKTVDGKTSNHSVGNAVDIAVIGGKTGKHHTNDNKGRCKKCDKDFKKNGDKVIDALKKIGYSSGESKSKDKAYLWWTSTGGNHYNHIHISNRRDK
jgi:hypothetical protein